MRSRFGGVCLTVLATLIIALSGCASGGLQKAGRSAADKEKLVKPGLFGDNAAADRLRGRFDFWNEEVVRQDVKVGTVFMGDSITELWDLNAYFAPSDGVIENRGIGGDITPHMAKRFEADVLQLRPRNVVILAGTNDAARMLGKNAPDDEIIATVMKNSEAMMDAARAAKINVFVCSILPTNPDTTAHEGKARILPRINEKLKASCKAKGCVYVDYWSATIDAQGALRKELARDGLHPHYAGYEIMARVLKEAAAANGINL
jgi:lysophospholipase L1-like esterase